MMAILMASGGITAFASPASALQEYESGQYGKARQDFERLIEKSPSDPKLRYNAGAAAYQEGAFEQALKHFGSSLTAPDLDLQERSYYNLGNTLYRSGEQAEEPAKKQAAWESAVKQYESALKLTAEDEDAKFNLQFVKAQLEKLKQQQQQQQQQNQQDNQKQDQDKNDQQKQQQQQQPLDQNQDAPPDQPKPSPQPQPDKQDRQPKESPQNQDQDQAPSKPSEQTPPPQPADGTAANGKEGQMPLEQALRLLESLESQEKPMVYAPPQTKPPTSRGFKDW